MIVEQARAEREIVRTVSSLVGPRPIILAGSRATGEATSESDYDVYVVLSTGRALRHLLRLRRAGAALSQRFGVPVTLNPLPSFRLVRPGPTLIVWKLRREGKVLAPPSFRLCGPRDPALDGSAIASYALSGLRYLTEGIDPPSLGKPEIPPAASDGVRKAIRHLAQIELLSARQYEPRLDDALAALPTAASHLRSFAGDANRSSTWFGVRDALVQRSHHVAASRWRRLIVNAQYVVLRAFRTRRPGLRALLRPRSIPDQLDHALVMLTLAIEPGGIVDDVILRAAAASLPEPWGNRPLSWTALRDYLDEHWGDAHPLAGF